MYAKLRLVYLGCSLMTPKTPINAFCDSCKSFQYIIKDSSKTESLIKYFSPKLECYLNQQVEPAFNQTFLLAVPCIHIITSHLFLNLFFYPLKTFLAVGYEMKFCNQPVTQTFLLLDFSTHHSPANAIA